jgi:hypothetical protein
VTFTTGQRVRFTDETLGMLRNAGCRAFRPYATVMQDHDGTGWVVCAVDGEGEPWPIPPARLTLEPSPQKKYFVAAVLAGAYVGASLRGRPMLVHAWANIPLRIPGTRRTRAPGEAFCRGAKPDMSAAEDRPDSDVTCGLCSAFLARLNATP